jgi:hypothetical protein
MLQVLFSAVTVVEQLFHAPIIDPDAFMLGVSLERVVEIAVDPLPGSAVVWFGDAAFFFPEFRGMR